ncbi:MAG: alpha/beta hydrolase [Chitinophagales bacterium]|nr:alpha/beta hydrolase [Chitinophagales bacterium]
MSFRSSDAELNSFLVENKLEGKLGYVYLNDIALRYLMTGNPEKETVFLFIHGAPGSLEMFNVYLKNADLLEQGIVVSIDRPGYGYANYGEAVVSIKAQAEIIAAFIKSTFPKKKVIVIGHSFGAPIAAYTGYLASDEVKAIVIASGAVDPELEKFTFLADFTNSTVIRSIASKETQVASLEKLAHKDELLQMKNIWSKLDQEVIAMHGDRDQIVPFDNVQFLKENVKSDKLTIDTLHDNGHMFVLRKNIIVDRLLRIDKKLD